MKLNEGSREEIESTQLYEKPASCGNREHFDKKITENQKIVDSLIYHFHHSHSTDYELRSFVREIIKDSTGRDIKDL